MALRRNGSTLLVMASKLPSSRESEPNPFAEALSKLVSVPRAEVQKRLSESPKEPISRHKRYKYAPAKP